MKMQTLLLAVTLLALAGCQKEGPAEKAGRSIDQAGKKAADSMDKAAKSVRDAVTPEKK